MILPLNVVLIYLAIGLIALGIVFLWRKDMRSIMWGVLTHMEGIHPLLAFRLLRYVAIFYVVIIIWFVWVLIVFAAILRFIRKRPNEEQVIEDEDVQPTKGETVSKEQVAHLERQIKMVGAGVVRGNLKSTLRKKASQFIRDKKRSGQKVVTVKEVLVNVDASPEFLKLCERIGYPRSEMVKMCIELGAVEKK